tara:strand:- start:537 stop:1595 length:1059 start_codon:yes stop_codon:yes gene_type:complete
MQERPYYFEEEIDLLQQTISNAPVIKQVNGFFDKSDQAIQQIKEQNGNSKFGQLVNGYSDFADFIDVEKHLGNGISYLANNGAQLTKYIDSNPFDGKANGRGFDPRALAFATAVFLKNRKAFGSPFVKTKNTVLKNFYSNIPAQKVYADSYPSSKITTLARVPKEFKQAADIYMRKAYTFKHTNPNFDLKNYPRFYINGEAYLPKTNMKAGQPMSLKLVSDKKKTKYAKTRANREHPWITDKQAITDAANRKGVGSSIDDILKDMKVRHAYKVDQIKKSGLTVGHLKSLANKGFDIAENITGEIGKSTIKEKGNFSRGFRNDLPDSVLIKKGSILNWDDYIEAYIRRKKIVK